jgi:histidinol-phosphatase
MDSPDPLPRGQKDKQRISRGIRRPVSGLTSFFAGAFPVELVAGCRFFSITVAGAAWAFHPLPCFTRRDYARGHLRREDINATGAHRYDAAMQSEHLKAALAAAEAAGEIIRKAYRGNFQVRYKADASPVTEVDVAAERAIRSVLQARFPAHGFYGEETGQDHADAEYLWLVDPIDGTKAFVRGYPLFSVQIALMHKGELVLGVSSAPCWNGGAGELIWAQKGRGAWLGGERLKASEVAEIGKATLSTGNLATLARSSGWAKLGGLVPRLHRIRGYGDFLHYHYLATGKIDAVIESDLNILDIAALAVIVREAGGTFTDLQGKPVGLKTSSVLATNGRLHKPLLEEFS